LVPGYQMIESRWGVSALEGRDSYFDGGSCRLGILLRRKPY